MCNPLECPNAARMREEWVQGPCGMNPGELAATVAGVVDTGLFYRGHRILLEGTSTDGKRFKADMERYYPGLVIDVAAKAGGGNDG